jgi:hypothetical protein
MTSRADAMAVRLPALYDTRPATLLAALLDQFALPVEAVDGERLRVQRAHWLPTATDRADIARLGALLDRRMEDWEDADLFRDRLTAIARARLAGAVTTAAVLGFVEDLLRAGRHRLGLDVAAAGPVRLVENPPLTGRHVAGPLTPLDRVTVNNDGLDETVLEATLIGLPGARSATPVFAVPGFMLGWAGVIPPGSRLHLRAVPDQPDQPAGAGLRADLDGADVSDLLFSVEDYTPGQDLTAVALRRPARPLRLPVGETTLWYLTAGLYERPALDAVMFAVARESLRQGRFDEDEWDEALLFQPPPVWAEFHWVSAAPATFEVRLPGGVATASAPLWPERDQARERLALLLDTGVGELRGAGVRAGVVLEPLRESMPVRDRVGIGASVRLRDGPPGIGPGPEPAFGALLDQTPLDGSRLE